MIQFTNQENDTGPDRLFHWSTGNDVSYPRVGRDIHIRMKESEAYVNFLLHKIDGNEGLIYSQKEQPA